MTVRESSSANGDKKQYHFIELKNWLPDSRHRLTLEQINLQTNNACYFGRINAINGDFIVVVTYSKGELIKYFKRKFR